jgi:hypothetical protein
MEIALSFEQRFEVEGLEDKLYRIQNRNDSNIRPQIKGHTAFHVLIFMAAVFILGGEDSVKAFIAKETKSIVKVR